MIGKKLFTYTEVDDNTPIQKLSLSDQLRVLVRKLTNADKEQLKADDAETAYTLQLKADLLEFFYKATDKVRKGEHRSVTMSVSSKFMPVLDEVLNSPSIATYYTHSIVKPDIDYTLIHYTMHVTLEVRAY